MKSDKKIQHIAVLDLTGGDPRELQRAGSGRCDHAPGGGEDRRGLHLSQCGDLHSAVHPQDPPVYPHRPGVHPDRAENL